MPVPPTYYPVLKRMNKVGPSLLRDLPTGEPLSAAAVRGAMARGALVIDARAAAALGAGHIPGARFAGFGPDFAAWTGWLAPYDRDLILVLETDEQFTEVQTELHRIGLDRIAGYLAGGMAAWGSDRVILPHVTTEELARCVRDHADGVTVLDVRTDDEWREGHIAGAVHRFAGEIARGASPPIAREVPVAVICGSGYRSNVAASLLEDQEYHRLLNVVGGMEAWEAAGLLEVREDHGARDGM